MIREVHSWGLSIQIAGKVEDVAVDPQRLPASDVPTTAILKELDRLGNDGWTVVHVSEDRAINDDASKSSVTCQRYLLSR